MEGFKDFYNNRNGKMILFFGFYLIFFIFLGIYMKNLDNKPKNNSQDQNKIEDRITTYDISNLINNDYQYNVSILDNNDTIIFKGTKSNIDYANYSNKYFLDIYNINQLLKKSKFVNSDNLVLTYELNNSELNDILLTKAKEAINTIKVFVNENGEIEKIMMDLKNYFEKENYQITIDYLIGDVNENSIS